SRELWPTTLIAIGVTAFAGTHIAATLQFEQKIAVRLIKAAAGVFILYCIVVLFIADSFLVAILDYLPAVILLGWVFLTAYRRTHQQAFRNGFVGVCMMLVAASVQQAKLGIHPKYFNHNAVYHLIQEIALLMVFTTARYLKKTEA